MQPLNNTSSIDPETIAIVGVAKGTLTASGTSHGTYTGKGIRRRYSDFAILHAHLIRHHPYVIIPPIPMKEGIVSGLVGSVSALWNKGKQALSQLKTSATSNNDGNAVMDEEESETDNDDGIVKSRRRLLNDFLKHSVQQNDFVRDSVFVAFLTASDNTWKALLKPATSETFQGPIVITDPNLLELDSYFAKLGEHCHSALNHQRSLLKCTKTEKQCSSDLGQTLNAFSLELMDDDIQHTDRMKRESFRQQANALAKMLECTGEAVDAQVEPLMRQVMAEEAAVDYIQEIVHLCEATRVMLRRLAAKQQSLTKANDNLQTKRNGLLVQREVATISNSSSRDASNDARIDNNNQMINASQDQIHKMEEERNEIADTLVHATSSVQSQLYWVQGIIGTLWKKTLMLLTSAKEERHQNGAKAWSACIGACAKVERPVEQEKIQQEQQ